MPSFVDIRCPGCGDLWDRRTTEADPGTRHVNCRCKREFTYKVEQGGRVTVLSVQDKSGSRTQPTRR